MEKPKLPVTRLAKEALALPFENLHSFIRLGFVPIMLTFAAQFLGGLLAGVNEDSFFNFMWFPLYTLIAIPLVVAWTRLAVLGKASIVGRPKFRVGRVEIRYFVGSILIAVFLFGPAAIAVWWAYKSSWATAPVVVA